MSEMKHTPGPWFVERQIQNYRSGATALCITSRGEGQVAQTVASIVSIDSGKANARLIAAAPTMYEYISSSASNGCAEAREMLEAIHASR